MIWRHTVPVILSSFLLGACATKQSNDWVAVEAEDARLILYSPLFPEDTHVWELDHEPRTGNRYEVLVSHHDGRVFRALLGNAGPGFAWTRNLTEPESWLRQWAPLRQARIEVGNDDKIKGPLGPIAVWRAAINGRSCATRDVYSGHDTEAMFNTDRIMGYFCTRRGHDLTDADIARTIEGFGVRGLQAPKASLRAR